MGGGKHLPQCCTGRKNPSAFRVNELYTSPSPKFYDESKIGLHSPMCILLKLHCAKFDVSRLF